MRPMQTKKSVWSTEEKNEKILNMSVEKWRYSECAFRSLWRVIIVLLRGARSKVGLRFIWDVKVKVKLGMREVWHLRNKHTCRTLQNYTFVSHDFTRNIFQPLDLFPRFCAVFVSTLFSTTSNEINETTYTISSYNRRGSGAAGPGKNI